MAITAAMVKELRERTGLGMMDCKKALQEANGDQELAIENLKKSSALKAAKKAGRTAADGLLGIKVAPDGSRAALVEVNIETDFAAKNEKFQAFVEKLAGVFYDADTADVATVMAGDLEAERETLVQEIGENISVRRATQFVSDGGYITSYLHGDARRGALVELSAANEEIGKDVAMHVTAMDPMVVKGEDVPAETVAKEREIFVAQAAESGKPPEIVEKMVEGRVRKFLAEISLVDQPFVKDSNTKVGQLLKSAGVECLRLVRYEVGAGIEKAEEDFAEEVRKQIEGDD